MKKKLLSLVVAMVLAFGITAVASVDVHAAGRCMNESCTGTLRNRIIGGVPMLVCNVCGLSEPAGPIQP